MDNRSKSLEVEEKEYQERVVTINRCTKVVKGGRRFSFSALVVIGNQKGQVGFGKGKAKDVSEAVRKATETAYKNQQEVTLNNGTVFHEVTGKFASVDVFMRPASPGTGVIAGGATRTVLELAGITDVLTKVFGSTNSFNVVRATINGLQKQKGREFFEKLRKTV